MIKKLCIVIALIIISVPLLADDIVKQKIIAFEQAVPWSDVYDSFKLRQASWHQDVKTAVTPQELGKLLVEFQGYIIKDRLGDGWDKVKDNWITKTSNASSFAEVARGLEQLQKYYFVNLQSDGNAVKKELIMFEQNVPWEDVREGFKTRQQEWHNDVINAKNPQHLAKLLLEFQEWIHPDRFSSGWSVAKHAWTTKTKNVKTWKDVQQLLKELQNHYVKGKQYY